MGTVDKIKEAWKVLVTPIAQATKHDAQAAFRSGSGTYRTLFTTSYNGEKNLGEIGPIKDYMPDYYLLSLRSWQAYTESEMAKTIIDKFILWIVSKGLKLQASPVKQVLESEGITVDTEAFNEITEARFAVWAKSRKSSYTGMDNLNLLAREAMKNAKVGGDVLVVLRHTEKGYVNVQLIDSALVQSPGFGTDYFGQKLSNGNTIRNGIELSPSGEHIAYHVRQEDMSFAMIPAKNSIGLVTAFLVYGNKHRLENQRGVPLISVCLETLKKLERYKEAMVGGAEERAKIVLQIVHSPASTGENPLSKNMAKAFDYNSTNDLPKDISGVELANNVAATTNKAAFNMPIGSEMKALESRMEMFFKEFYSTNADIICGAVGIPPNVAFSIYNDSFSASRAATKDWEHTITVNREDFTFQFYQPIYNFWLFTEIMKGKIRAEGYNKAVLNNNDMALEAYQNARFTGSMFPHIDPLKEVKAEREKLGVLAAAIPLTTVEAATEALNCGDGDSNMEQFAEELRLAESLEIEMPEVNTSMSARPAEKASVEEEED